MFATYRMRFLPVIAISVAHAACPAAETSPTGNAPGASAASGAMPVGGASATPTSVSRGGETCTPGFTPYSPEAGRCSAHHTVCRDGPEGPLCHGGAIIIECGESGERCGKTFFCDCGDAGRAVPPASAR